MVAALLAAWAMSPLFLGIDRGLRTADALSGGPSGCGPVTVWFYWQPQALDGHLSYAEASRHGAQCSLSVNIAALTRFRGAGVCMIAAHEGLHLHGRKHSANRRSIMHPDPPLHPRRGLCRSRQP